MSDDVDCEIEAVVTEEATCEVDIEETSVEEEDEVKEDCCNSARLCSRFWSRSNAGASLTGSTGGGSGLAAAAAATACDARACACWIAMDTAKAVYGGGVVEVELFTVASYDGRSEGAGAGLVLLSDSVGDGTGGVVAVIP